MEKQVYGIIYMIQNKINGKIYFGQTKHTFEKRYNYDDTRIVEDVSNEHLRNSINKYGINNFYINRKFDVAYSKEELDELEDLYICMYETMNPDKGCNKRRGGHGGRFNEEFKIKMSEVTSGHKNPMYGKHHTDESKRLISEHRKGKCAGENSIWYGKKKPKSQVEKMRKTRLDQGIAKGEKNPMYGKTHSQEAKEKMSKSSHCAKRVICLNTQQVFPSAKKAAEHFGLKHNLYVNRACKNKTYTTHPITKEKLYFEFVDEN